jgi:ribosomal protein L16/L10AE
LTERPGAGRCGTGTGETARTAFRVRDDHITEWLRVQDIPDAPDTLS